MDLLGGCGSRGGGCRQVWGRVDKVDVTFAGRYNTAGDVDGVFVSGNYAYVADGSNGIAILCSDMSGIDTTSTPSVRILGLSSSVRGGEGWLEQYPR